MAGNRSRFSKHLMTGSPIFSINLTNRKNPSNLNYHTSIKENQAILKCFIDLKFSVWFTLYSENETMFRDTYPRGGGVLDKSLGGEVRRGPSYPDPV